MNQQKIGEFLRELRKQKGLTQEQFAEIMNVSNRTISRWENGSNMPDLSLLVELADYYDVDIREIIDGERKSEKMENETKDTLLKVAEYSDAEKKKLKKRMIDMSIATLIILLFYSVLDMTNGFGGYIAEQPCQNMKTFGLGAAVGCSILNVLYFCGVLEKIRAWKLSVFKAK